MLPAGGQGRALARPDLSEIAGAERLNPACMRQSRPDFEGAEAPEGAGLVVLGQGEPGGCKLAQMQQAGPPAYRRRGRTRRRTLDRGRKQAQVDELRATFTQSGAVIVAHYSGLTVAEMSALRREMRDVGASFKVTKNTLARIALDGTPYASIQSMFTGPTGIAFAADPVAAAKAVVAYANRNDKFKIIGGGLGTTVMDAEGVRALAKMPPIEELRGRLLGVIVAPATQLVRILPAPATNVVGVLNAGAAKLVRVLHAYAAKQA